jgi:hypothetical protein
MRPSGHSVLDVPPSAPQLRLHPVVVLAHVTAQLPEQWTSQDEESAQVIVLPPPRSNLQLAVPAQEAEAFAPALSWHFEDELHVI